MWKIRALILFLSGTLISCDPFYDENIKIVNKSAQTLEFTIIQNIKKFQDTALIHRHNGQQVISSMQINDSIFFFSVAVPPDLVLLLHEASGIGEISYVNDETAKAFLKKQYDTVFLKSHILHKDLYDFSLWKREIRLKPSSSAFFECIIEDKDLK